MSHSAWFVYCLRICLRSNRWARTTNCASVLAVGSKSPIDSTLWLWTNVGTSTASNATSVICGSTTNSHVSQKTVLFYAEKITIGKNNFQFSYFSVSGQTQAYFLGSLRSGWHITEKLPLPQAINRFFSSVSKFTFSEYKNIKAKINWSKNYLTAKASFGKKLHETNKLIIV